MPGSVTFSDTEQTQDERPPKRRSGLRQRLIEAERGFSVGFRGNSSLFTHLFFCMTVILTASVLGIQPWEWVLLSISMICGFAAELFHLAVKELSEHLDTDKGEKAAKLSAAGMVMVMIAAGVVMLFILGTRFVRMLS